ncbi:MAG: hypothetical protein IJ497_03895, partial [Clostridia bacterium]|nr:hypothetical protein [Clostridia bacterium]
CEGYLFRSSGYTVKFPGYMALYEESTDDAAANDEKNTRLPNLMENEMLPAESVKPTQHFTEPPARYPKRPWSSCSKKRESAVLPPMQRSFSSSSPAAT